MILSSLTRVILFKMWRCEGVTPAPLPPCSSGRLPFDLQRYVDTYWATMFPHDVVSNLVPFGLLTLSWILARRIDVNEFSMHHFYRNRLVRAYLGASRSPRRPPMPLPGSIWTTT